MECSGERAIGFDNEVWASWNYLSFELRLVVERLLAPLDAVTRWAVVVLKADESLLWFGQGWQHLALLQLRWSRPLGPWSGESARQPLGQWEVDRHGIGWLMVVDWRKASVMLRPRRRRSCFRDRCSQLISACLPKIGCQGWTRTNTERFNKPSCYFDTTWQ